MTRPIFPSVAWGSADVRKAFREKTGEDHGILLHKVVQDVNFVVIPFYKCILP